MISEQAINEFLNRELMEFEWLKQLSPTQIDAALNELVPSDLTANLWPHQKVCLLVAQHHPRFIFHVDMGGGKSYLMLTTLKHRKLLGENPRTLVLVPYLTAVDTWVGEVAKFAPELKCCPLLGSSQENLAAIKSSDDIYVMCYQSAVAMVTAKILKQGKTKWALDLKLVKEAFGGIDTLILDEIHKAKSASSLTFKLCRSLSQRASHVYGLTGTPFGKDLQDLWSQFYLIDFGETLGPTLSFYRTVFFVRKEGFWGGSQFKFRKKLLPQLQRLIKNKSIRYGANEFSSLEKPLSIPMRFTLPEGVRGYVERATEELKKGVIGQDYEVAGNAFLQLRQLSSGFITFKDQDDRIKVKFDSSPKLDALCELITEMPPECKMVVFHEFVFTNQMISERLTELKIDHARIWGGQRDPLGELAKFRSHKNCRVLVINSRSGSSSLNLQFASYLCFFEQPTSPIDRQQAEARVQRPGQLRRVVIYDLFVTGTYDERMHASNQEGENLLQLLLDRKQEV